MRNLRNIGFCILSVRRTVCVLSALAVFDVGFLFSQDYTRLSERTIIGTARYVGMSGAMTAIGGDPSAVTDNPAGLGLYRRAEAMATMDIGIDRTLQTGQEKTGKTLRFSLAQASAVFSLGDFSKDDGLIAYNFMISYKRHRTFFRDYYGYAGSGSALAPLLSNADVEWDIAIPNHRTHDSNAFRLYERGQVNEFGLDWAMNYSNKLYFGLGLRIHSYSLTEDALYQEVYGKDSLYNKSYVSHSGVGVGVAAGFIYRPLSWLRLGLAIHTPTLGSLRTYTDGKLQTKTDTLGTSNAPSLAFRDMDFHLPVHLSTSAAFQIGAYGMIALQYDLYKQLQSPIIHSLRAGVEVIPVMGMYINAGYACESTFKKEETPVLMDPTFDRQDTYSQFPRTAQYASVALGYRGSFVMVQAAYQYRWQHIDLFAHENAAPYDMNATTHRIVITIGWHR